MFSLSISYCCWFPSYYLLLLKLKNKLCLIIFINFFFTFTNCWLNWYPILAIDDFQYFCQIYWKAYNELYKSFYSLFSFFLILSLILHEDVLGSSCILLLSSTEIRFIIVWRVHFICVMCMYGYFNIYKFNYTCEY
jgi:hypothetical protein